MAEAARPLSEELVRRIIALESRVSELERTPSGRQSIGILHIRPSTKAGTPSDADFTTTPPVGAIVIDTSANKIWVRTSAGTWRYSLLT